MSLPDVLVVGGLAQAAVSIDTSAAGTAPTPTITWETSDSAVLRVDASGRAEAVSAGAAFVTARDSPTDVVAKVELAGFYAREVK